MTVLEESLQYRNAYFLALSATTGYVCFGWVIGLIDGVLALPSFQQYFGLDKASAAARAALSGNIVSVLQAGGLLGAVGSTWFANRYGRKPTMLGSAVVFLVGSVIQSIVGLGSTPAVGLKLFYVGRFVGGIGAGVMSALVPTYVSECAPRAIRGRCTGSIEVAVGLGNMLSFWVNYGVSIRVPSGEIQWRLAVLVQIVPGALFLLLMLFQPESPRWLVEKERDDDAAKSLAYIARTDPRSPSVQSTLSEIRADFAGRRPLGLLSQFRVMGESKTIALRCVIPCLLTFFQQWTGTNAINYYSPEIFAALGISGTAGSLLATGIYGVVKFLSTCLALVLLIDAPSWGRKRTLIYGGLAQALTMFWLGGYSALHPHPHPRPGSASTYGAILAVYAFGVAFSLGWGITPLALGSEIAPGHLRPAVMALATGTTWMFTYVIAQATPRMLACIGWGTFIVFGVAGVGMAVWVWAGVPETRGVSLEHVARLFEGEMWTRFVQDAPGGSSVLDVLGRRRVEALEACDVI